MSQPVKLSDFLGAQEEEDFLDFDFSEIQEVLGQLQQSSAIDLPHAEALQQKALRGADILTEYLGKIIKTIGTLEAKVNRARNNASLNYKDPDGGKVTAEMRKMAAEISPEVESLLISLAKAKASKTVIEKKFDILIKQHHFLKSLGEGLKKTILGYSGTSSEFPNKVPNGWE